MDDELPSITVVSAVADALDTDPTDLEPLYATIDPDALDRLFEETTTGRWRFGGQVSFSMEGCHVTVHGNSKVIVTPPKSVERDERTTTTG